MQVIGLCRFSYPGEGGFHKSHDSLDDQIAYLYAPERLEERFRTFECFTLPSLRAQTDPEFTFLIVIGESLPREHRDRLEALVADLPQAVIQAHAPGPHRDVMRKAINSVRQTTGTPSLQFRLDDDDAVAVTYVEKLRHAAAHVAGLLQDHRHFAIDFTRGHAARPGPKGLATAPIEDPYWTAGLAMMFRPDVPLTIMNFHRRRLLHKMPALIFPEEEMMLRGVNGFNDSDNAEDAPKLRLKKLGMRGEDKFRRLYNIDADHVRRVFSG